MSQCRTRKNQKVWTDEERAILRDAHNVLTLIQVSKLLPGRNIETIARKSGQLGWTLLRKTA